LAPKATLSDTEATARKEVEMAEATHTLVMEASKEGEATPAPMVEAEKGAEPLKEATRILVTEASKEGEAMPVPMTEAEKGGGS
jgi:hypothetical protein